MLKMKVDKILGMKLSPVQERILDLFECQEYKNVIMDREQIKRLYRKTYSKGAPHNFELHLDRLACSKKIYGIPNKGNFKMFSLLKPDYFDLDDSRKRQDKRNRNWNVKKQLVSFLLRRSLTPRKYVTFQEICDYFLETVEDFKVIEEGEDLRKVLRKNLTYLMNNKKVFCFKNHYNRNIYSLISNVDEVFK